MDHSAGHLAIALDRHEKGPARCHRRSAPDGRRYRSHQLQELGELCGRDAQCDQDRQGPGRERLDRRRPFAANHGGRCCNEYALGPRLEQAVREQIPYEAKQRHQKAKDAVLEKIKDGGCESLDERESRRCATNCYARAGSGTGRWTMTRPVEEAPSANGQANGHHGNGLFAMVPLAIAARKGLVPRSQAAFRHHLLARACSKREMHCE